MHNSKSNIMIYVLLVLRILYDYYTQKYKKMRKVDPSYN